MTETQRNMLILVAIAVLGSVFTGVFSVGAGGAMVFLNIAFAIAIMAFVVIQYRSKAGTIASLPTLPRLVLQLSVIGLFVLAIGMLNAPFLPWPLGWQAGNGVLWFTLLLACGFGIWWAWQQRATRW